MKMICPKAAKGCLCGDCNHGEPHEQMDFCDKHFTNACGYVCPPCVPCEEKEERVASIGQEICNCCCSEPQQDSCENTCEGKKFLRKAIDLVIAEAELRGALKVKNAKDFGNEAIPYISDLRKRVEGLRGGK